MLVKKFDIEGLLLLQPSVFEDPRGYFLESFNEQVFRSVTGLDADFVQDNESKSDRGVLRGLHFQVPPHTQAKLVRVVQGAVLDVAVDLRKSSPTYGRHQKVLLSGKNKLQFFIPEGFAHGFAVLEAGSIFAYKCTNFYHRDSERVLLWNDPSLAIDWQLDEPQLSDKDRAEGRSLRDLNSPF